MAYVIRIFICLLFSGLPVAAQTILQPGDLAILGLASNVGGLTGGCAPGGSGQLQGRDRISFVAFKAITTGTTIDITDNGWERRQPGRWGNTEGFLRVTRTGPTLPAGQVITFELPPTNSDYVAISPDTEWSFTPLGTNALNFNDGGDQLYFMQGGVWDNGTTIGCCNGEQDARYTGGRLLFAFNSTSQWQGLTDDSQDSALHPDLEPCFYMAPTSGVTNFTSYQGPITDAIQLEWISRIADPSNWSAYADCPSYLDPLAQLPIGPSGWALACLQCRSCEPFQDSLLFSLPQTGGPFQLTFTNSSDTLTQTGVSDGDRLALMIDANTTYSLLEVRDANGCPLPIDTAQTATFRIEEAPVLGFARVEPVSCSDMPNGLIELEIVSSSPVFINWNVDSLDGRILATGLAEGLYVATVEGAEGCEVSDSVQLTFEGIFLELGPDVSIAKGDSVQLNADINFVPDSITWMPDDGSLIDPDSLTTWALPSQTTRYTLQITDGQGCTLIDDILVSVEDQSLIYVPNVFSPNQDGINDIFTIFPGDEIREISSLLILDRWGNAVYQSNNFIPDGQNGWRGIFPNGELAPSGVYIYFLKIIDASGQEEVIRGTLTLIR